MEAESPYRRPREVVPGSGGEEPDVLADELAGELLAARLIANLATLNRDGSVHLVGMWFLWDGDALLMPTSGRTRKAKNLQRDPRATVTIDDSRGGLDLRGVTMTGRATVEGGAGARAQNRRIHLKYLTERGRALAAVDRYLDTDDVTIRFVPERIGSWNLRDTDQSRALLETGEFLALEDR
jgi:PPOX class probable F420-dependent enzyme